MKTEKKGLTPKNKIVKRGFDILFACLGIFLCFWVIPPIYLLATIDTRKNGFFTQVRVGRFGKKFRLYKIRTMRSDLSCTTNVTTARDPRITKLGRILRYLKLDELPQLWNVLKGDMSFVGPRPDVPGFADRLQGSDRIILSIRPGITGPASLKYKNEESLLAYSQNPEEYNRKIIFPDKVKINKGYIINYSFAMDIKYIIRTLIS